ncbi:MAG: glutamate synthase subunit beta [Actinomycetota bacterium]|nr:glutamate synthase subunit beta [Actinomycetota bacterium]
MADPRGFMKHGRKVAGRRPVDVRIQDWREVYQPFPPEHSREQASRCMDCGIPFCHDGCPLGNRIPEWNDLVRRDDWRDAIEQLHATNNFPEFTGRLCPAPCEAACVLGIADAPVSIKQVEVDIIDRAFAEGWVHPQLPVRPTGRRIAVIGSGPAGLAAAQQLTRAGHDVTVFERDDALGGLCRYGIPDFKMEKHHVDRRVEQMVAEGTRFVVSCEAGVDITGDELRAGHDAIVLAAGAPVGRELPIPGRDLAGVHLAMEHLVPANRVVAGRLESTPIDAKGKHVVIIGGGDTAADCLGTAHRQGAASVTQLDIYPEPPPVRDAGRTPWPTWPWLLRSYPAHEEGGERVFAVQAEQFVGDDRGDVRGLQIREVQVVKDASGRRNVSLVGEGTRDLPCDLALLAIGFDGAERGPLLDQLGVDVSPSGRIECGPAWQTSSPGVFVAGDMKRGASLIVWAIAEGRAAAAAVDAYVSGDSTLPSPVSTASAPLV